MRYVSPMDLSRAIASHLSEWERAVVELAIYGTDDAATIAATIDRFVTDELGAHVFDCVFYRTSVGSVAGLVLDDGRRVVVKAHQPHVRRERLVAVHDVMRTLSRASFPCPAPILEPRPIGRGLATVEALIDEGEVRDGHEPVVRRELAHRLAEMARLIEPTRAHEALRESWFSGLPPDRLWPRPHSPLFDFEATRSGAERIDAIAADARRAPRSGRRIVGHFDWRAEHARFRGDRIVVAYDWDSLHVDLEPVLVGAAAHAFCADWERDESPAVPSLDAMLAFVLDYEQARGRPFEDLERRTLAGSLVYSLAYTARCTHALGAHASERALGFRELLEMHGRTLLETL